MRASSVVKRQSTPYCVPVALLLPRSHLPPQSALVGNTAVQALPGHHPDFDLRHIQPTAMLGSVMDLQPFGDAPRFGRSKASYNEAGWWVFKLSITSTIRSCAGSPRPPVA